MPNDITSKTTLVALLAAIAVVVTAGSLIYQANAQSDSNEDDKEGNRTYETRFFEKGVFAGGDVFTYAGNNLDIDGSVNITEQVADQILTEAQVSFPEAAATAANAVDNGKAINGNLGVIEGFLVYSFTVVDDESRIFTVIVDAGNGGVLHTSEPMDSMPGAVVGSILGPAGFSPFNFGHPGMAAVKVIQEPVEEEN